MDGSFNLAGIADPVIDALIDKVIEAKSRAELVTATRAIDRVLRAGHYWVPHWYKAVAQHRLLGQVLAPGREAEVRPRHPRHLVVSTPTKAAQARRRN